jgi:hypothetical protein
MHYESIFSKEHFKELPKVACITSIFGDYDELQEQSHIDGSNVDWFCFSDKNIKSKRWKVITTPYHLKDDVSGKNSIQSNLQNLPKLCMMSAKYYKIKSHHIPLLQSYDYIVWIDARIAITEHFIPFVFDMMTSGKKLIHYKHSVRKTVKDEVSESNNQPRYVEQNVNEQYERYLHNGFPDQSGLFENGMFIRTIRDKKINNLFDVWWKHNVNYSFQDQISYPYVLWESNLYPDYIITDTVWYGKYTHITNGHK